MGKENLILVRSKRMDTNKKEKRNENGLIRMSQASRDHMGFDDNKVEVYPDSKKVEDRLHKTKLLTIFKAFSSDIRDQREKGMTPNELRRVGFVTSKTYNMIVGNKSNTCENIWVADNINDTVIGADPEFLLFNDDIPFYANRDGVLPHYGELGYDGAMAEVRPEPAMTPDQLVKNIERVFKNKKLTSGISHLKWMTGCYFRDHRRDFPIGGHIHIGNPTRIAGLPGGDREYFFKILNKILDELLALPMIRLDGAELGSARRTKCTMGKYGYFGEWRVCNGRLEHRTLSGMWLTHPSLAKCVLGTAKAIINEVFGMIASNKYQKKYIIPSNHRNSSLFQANFNSWGDIPLTRDLDCVKSSKYMKDILNASRAGDINAKYLKDWHNKMRQLSTYKKYSKYIDALYELLKLNVKHFSDFDKQIQNNWLKKKKFLVDV